MLRRIFAAALSFCLLLSIPALSPAEDALRVSLPETVKGYTSNTIKSSSMT